MTRPPEPRQYWFETNGREHGQLSDRPFKQMTVGFEVVHVVEHSALEQVRSELEAAKWANGTLSLEIESLEDQLQWSLKNEEKYKAELESSLKRNILLTKTLESIKAIIAHDYTFISPAGMKFFSIRNAIRAALKEDQ